MNLIIVLLNKICCLFYNQECYDIQLYYGIKNVRGATFFYEEEQRYTFFLGKMLAVHFFRGFQRGSLNYSIIQLDNNICNLSTQIIYHLHLKNDVILKVYKLRRKRRKHSNNFFTRRKQSNYTRRLVLMNVQNDNKGVSTRIFSQRSKSNVSWPSQ